MRLPNGWSEELLEDVSDGIDYGHTASSTTRSIGPKFLRITDIQNGTVDWKNVPHCEASGSESARYELNDGDIVFARTGATTGKSFLIRSCPKGAVFASYLIRVRPHKRLFPPFLSRFFETPNYWRQITKSSSGSAQPGVNSTKLKQLRIPIPPLAEQRRIAAILDKADAIRRKRSRAIELTEQFLKSAYLEMFGDPVTNSKGWKQHPLGTICDVGSSKRVFVNELVETGVPFYRGTEIGQLGNGQIVEPTLFITKEHYLRLKTQTGIPQKGDLLLPSICPDGRIHLVENDEPFYFKDGRVLWIKVDQTRINSVYLKLYLKQSFFSNYAKIASGTTFAELKIFALKDLSIHVPPLEQQQRFSDFVKSIDRRNEKTRVQLATMDSLFNSLVQRAFRGELTG